MPKDRSEWEREAMTYDEATSCRGPDVDTQPLSPEELHAMYLEACEEVYQQLHGPHEEYPPYSDTEIPF